ncbi:IS110 family transposase [Thermanaerosceptrum fracticalcis]|uniref:IS110 family transposase n=1 Tax=Thermanaerosceptrum fracticalcis TaxID=1712410 RepID=A0A7G6E6K4_THEFR|nr:IS110 family transposase [Thermanaerosceptrum fracticalcis]QNB47708.1 IS110 family transposase [Thermanaerosceptrum fracticalcis]
MISVGIDVSKEKSTVCIMKPYGEIISKPFEIQHVEQELNGLSAMLLRLDDEVRVVMEATGIYHLPVLSYLQGKKIFVAVINPFEMKEYRCRGLRRVKTDKQDAITISNYGIDHWYRLKNYEADTGIYEELKLLGRQYRHYMRMRVESVLELTHLLDYTMPGIKTLLKGWNETNGKDKLSDFAEEYWHYDNITKKSEKQFINSYLKWAEKKGYHQNQDKAAKIYALAKEGIPTLSSGTPSVKILVQEAVRVLREVDNTLMRILTQMQELAKTLPEYPVVRAMGGVGNVLAPKLIAEIGDVRRFHNGKALIAYTGIDAPPYQSGQFTGTERKISKRGSSSLRKIGYEVMRCLKTHKAPEDDAVYQFILKKEREGKSKCAAKIAGLNKFLRIYYARVMEVYQR